MPQKEGAQLKLGVRREAAVEGHCKSLPVCVFILTLQVRGRCEDGAAVFFSVVPLASEMQMAEKKLRGFPGM